MLTTEAKADIEVVKRLISMREKIRSIQRELNSVHDFLDQTANDFMENMISKGAVEAVDYTGDQMEDLAG